jgi:hypothetical protein
MQAHKVIDFRTTEEAMAFLEALRRGIERRQRDYRANRFPVTFGPVSVYVWSLNAMGAAAFAAQRQSVPRPTPMTYFLSEGASVACDELALGTLDLGGTDKTIPQQAKLELNAVEFRTVAPYASVTAV